MWTVHCAYVFRVIILLSKATVRTCTEDLGMMALGFHGLGLFIIVIIIISERHDNIIV